MAKPKPPGSGTLGDEIRRIDRRLNELSRGSVSLPRCAVQLTQDAVVASTTVFAQANWKAVYDPDGMFLVGGITGHTYSTIQIVRAGYYRLHYHSQVTGTSATASGKITLNAATTGNAVAADAHQVLTTTGDGAVLDAHREHIYLNVGDTLYWANWSSANATLRATVGGVPAEITAHYLGSL